MDEELLSHLVFKYSTFMASLEDKDNVYRFVQIEARDRRHKAYPAEREFEPKPADKRKLSVDAASITTPEDSLARLGGTYRKGCQVFKDYTKWELYSLNVGIIKLMDKSIDVIDDPIIVNPPEKGRPSNPAHSLIDLSSISEFDLPEIILKLRNHAKDYQVAINMTRVDEMVKEYCK